MGALSDSCKQVGAEPLPANVADPAEVRDESAEFAILSLEMDKFQSLSGDSSPDWSLVIRTASELVKSQSKDLLAISYLVRALFERESYAGLAAGLQILSDVINQHWETAFPPLKRAKRRGNEISWLFDKLLTPVTTQAPATTDREDVYAATELLLAIESLLAEKLDDHAPQIYQFRDQLKDYRDRFQAEEQATKQAEELAEQKRQEQPEKLESKTPTLDAEVPTPAPAKQSPAPAAAAETTRASSPAISAPPSIAGGATDAEIAKALKAVRTSALSIAATWREHRLSDLRPYLLIRYAAWMGLSPPPEISLPGPTRNQISECNRLLENGEHRALIELSESILANPDAPPNRYWLDGHRYTATALKALGKEFEPACNSVVSAVRFYLEQVSSDLDREFSDQVPYADDQTRMWIQTQVMTAQPASTESNGNEEESGRSLINEALTEARQLAASGDKAGAVAVFNKPAAQSASHGSTAFAVSLEQARLCSELGYGDVALALLDGLNERSMYYHLDEWQPSLSVDFLKLTIKTIKKSGKADPERLGSLIGRLARLDPAASIDLLKQ